MCSIAAGLGNNFYKGTIITMTVIVAHFVSTVVVEAIQCIPMEKYWNQAVSGHCINITAFFYCKRDGSNQLRLSKLIGSSNERVYHHYGLCDIVTSNIDFVENQQATSTANWPSRSISSRSHLYYSKLCQALFRTHIHRVEGPHARRGPNQHVVLH